MYNINQQQLHVDRCRLSQKMVTDEKTTCECLALIYREVVEDYPNDTPLPEPSSAWMADERPLHVVVADNADDKENIVITVYEPDLTEWESDFKRRST